MLVLLISIVPADMISKTCIIPFNRTEPLEISQISLEKPASLNSLFELISPFVVPFVSNSEEPPNATNVPIFPDLK